MCEACPIIDWEHELPTIRSFTTSRVDADVSDLIVWYDKYESTQKALVGGKNASLGEMMRAELPVPPGFALTTDAYGMIWRDKELVDSVNELLQGLDHVETSARELSAACMGDVGVHEFERRVDHGIERQRRWSTAVVHALFDPTLSLQPLP